MSIVPVVLRSVTTAALKIASAAMATSQSGHSSVIDLQSALERMGGDRDLFCTLAGFYVQDVPPLINSLQQAVQRGEHSEVEYLAHSIKGLSSTFDAHRVCELAKRIERIQQSNPAANIEAEVSELATAVDAVIVALRDEVDPGTDRLAR